MKAAVFGSHGFIGRATTDALRLWGMDVLCLDAPRLESYAVDPEDLAREAERLGRPMADRVTGVDVVVNAAGLASPGAVWGRDLAGANSLLPGVLAVAAREAGARRMIHVSSAAVQGRVACLDESDEYHVVSPYARSKALGERTLKAIGWMEGTVIYRPTSVHGPDRSLTHSLRRVACSRAAVVAAPGNDPTPQVHIDNVARAISVIATARECPDTILHPWEGLTTASVLAQLSGGRQPRFVNRAAASSLVSSAMAVARLDGRLFAAARRLEMLFFGQHQLSGWLLATEPSLGVPHAGWRILGQGGR